MGIFSPVVFDPATNGLRNAKPSDTLNINSANSTVYAFVNSNSGTINKGQTVYIKSDGGVDLAKGDASLTAQAIGLVSDTSISTGTVGNVVVSGSLTLTAAEWDSIAGTTGGLAPGKPYFISIATAGGLQEGAPSGDGKYAQYIGKATSSTTLFVSPGVTFGL